MRWWYIADSLENVADYILSAERHDGENIKKNGFFARKEIIR